MYRNMRNSPLSVARAAVVLPVMSRLRPWKTRWSLNSEKEDHTMRVSTSNTSMTRALCLVTVVLGCLSTGHASTDVPITIVNNLEQSLVFKEIKNRQDVQIKSDPPAEIPPHSSGQFKARQGTSGKNQHLNIKYTIKDTADQVGIVYKYDQAKPHCPKDHPDWNTETVQHCGNWSVGWTYTFAPK